MTQEQQWTAVEQREQSAEFVYAVKTTGVYCRPSCPARLAKRENVQFFDSCAAAEDAGFRACKRCHPDGASIEKRQREMVERVCQRMAESEQMPRLAELAGETNLSLFHLQRTFKHVTGVTPRAYFAAQRADRMRHELRAANSITDAIYNAGYGSGSRFYSDSTERLGMKPKQFRDAGKELRIRFATADCSLGVVLVAATEAGVCAILLGATEHKLKTELATMFAKARLEEADTDFAEWVSAVTSFVETPARGLALPLDIRGTAFQQRVWQILRGIPSGSTLTYTEVAERMGAPKAVRAVAHACATNRLAIAVPCHRVVGKTGKLTGYRWGLERKQALLERECDPKNTATQSR